MHRTNITGRLFYIYIWELPIFLAMAVVCGMAGALFVAANIRLRRLRRCLMTWDTPRQWWRSAEVRLGDSDSRSWQLCCKTGTNRLLLGPCGTAWAALQMGAKPG